MHLLKDAGMMYSNTAFMGVDKGNVLLTEDQVLYLGMSGHNKSSAPMNNDQLIYLLQLL